MIITVCAFGDKIPGFLTLHGNFVDQVKMDGMMLSKYL